MVGSHDLVFSEEEVLEWKIKRVVQEARRLGIDDAEIDRLEDAEVNGRTLISLINDGKLETVVSEDAAKAVLSIIQFPAGRRTLKEVEGELAEVQRQLAAFSFIDVWGACSHASKSSNSRTRDENLNFRASLVVYYALEQEKCMLTGMSGRLKAAHIWPWAQSKHPSLLKLRISQTDIDSPRNGLLLLASIEMAFDKKDLCFLYNPFNRRFVARVLNPTLMTQQYVAGGDTFGDLDNEASLTLPEGRLPFRRLLNTHARAAYRNAYLAGWITMDMLKEFEDYANLSDKSTETPIDFEDESLPSRSE